MDRVLSIGLPFLYLALGWRSDHLGGTIRVLNEQLHRSRRDEIQALWRGPGYWQSSLNTDRKFTGQTEDEAAGLYWYASRAYDPEIGRFVLAGSDCAYSW